MFEISIIKIFNIPDQVKELNLLTSYNLKIKAFIGGKIADWLWPGRVKIFV